MDATNAAVIAGFIKGRFPDVELGPDDDIFSLGFINSLFAMELVMFIERTFAITLPAEELQFNSFRTVRGMSELVDRQVVPAATGPERR